MSARRIAASIGWSVGLSALLGVQGCADTVAPVPPIPFRQRAPISNYRVPTSRPTFRWFTPHPELEHTVTICADRDCQRVEEALTTRGSSVQPSRDLPRGVHFWRVTSRWEGADRATPVWQLRTTWDTHADVRGADRGDAADYNGDGLSDIAIVTADPGVEIVYGGNGRGDSSFVDPGASSAIGRVSTILGAADLNGDGFDDLAMGIPGTARDRVVVFYGSAEGLSNAHRDEVPSSFPDGTWFVSSAVKHPRRADLDQDGMDDLLLRAGPAPDGQHYLQGNAVLWHEDGRLQVSRPDRSQPTQAPRLLLPVVPVDQNLDGAVDLFATLRRRSGGGNCRSVPLLGPSFSGRGDSCIDLPEFTLRPFPLQLISVPVTACDLQHDRTEDVVEFYDGTGFVVQMLSEEPSLNWQFGSVPGNRDVTCFHGEDGEYLFVQSSVENRIRTLMYARSADTPQGNRDVEVVTELSAEGEWANDSCLFSSARLARAGNVSTDVRQSILLEVECRSGVSIVVGSIAGSVFRMESSIHRSGIRDYFL